MEWSSRVLVAIFALSWTATGCARRSSDGAGVRETGNVDAGQVAPSASSAPSPVPPVVVRPAPVGCTVTGERVVDRGALGFRVSRVSDVRIAAHASRALVTFAVDGDHGCEQDGCGVFHELYAFDVDAHGTPAVPHPVRSASVGVSPSADGAPMVVGDELLVLSQGHAGAAAMTVPGQDSPDTMYLVRGDDVLWRSEKWFSGAYAGRASSDGALVVGTGIEWTQRRDGVGGPPSVRAFRIAKDMRPEGKLIVSRALEGAAYDAPAMATSNDRAAIAFRRGKTAGRGPHTLSAAWIDPETAKAEASPVTVDSGDVGPPALALDGDTLHIVFAKRERPADAYTLRHATWTRGAEAPSAPVALMPSGSGIAPALAMVGGRFAIAWSRVGAGNAASIHAGSGASIEAAAASAVVVSGTAKHAREPAWAETDGGAFLVWTERGASPRIRIARCE
jgi:hypothetical protein